MNSRPGRSRRVVAPEDVEPVEFIAAERFDGSSVNDDEPGADGSTSHVCGCPMCMPEDWPADWDEEEEAT